MQNLFDARVATYPGQNSPGTTGKFRLLGPQTSFINMPPRTLSEALRKLDLIVTIGERGHPRS